MLCGNVREEEVKCRSLPQNAGVLATMVPTPTRFYNTHFFIRNLNSKADLNIVNSGILGKIPLPGERGISASILNFRMQNAATTLSA